MTRQLLDSDQTMWRFPVGAAGAGTVNTLRTPATGNKIRVRGAIISAVAATVITIRLGASKIVSEMHLPANGSASYTLPGAGVLGATDAVLQMISSAATTVAVTVLGQEE